MARSPIDGAERIGVTECMKITGFSRRTVQEKAALRIIPSAAKLAGGDWSFDEQQVRRWVRQKEREHECPKTSSNVRVSGTPDSRDQVTTIDRAYEHVLGRKRNASSARSANS